MPRLQLSDHANTFATRGLAREFREALEQSTDGGQSVEIDFSGVTHVSYSFADELVGKLSASEGLDVRPTHMSPVIAETVNGAVARRRAPALT